VPRFIDVISQFEFFSTTVSTFVSAWRAGRSCRMYGQGSNNTRDADPPPKARCNAGTQDPPLGGGVEVRP